MVFGSRNYPNLVWREERLYSWLSGFSAGDLKTTTNSSFFLCSSGCRIIEFKNQKDVWKQLKLVLEDCGNTLWRFLAPRSQWSCQILVGTFSNPAPFYTTGSVGEHSLGRFSMSSLFLFYFFIVRDKLNYYSNSMTEKQIQWYKIFIKL